MGLFDKIKKKKSDDEEGKTTKIFLGIILFAGIGVLSGCMVTEDYDEYERKQFRSTDEISEIIAKDSSTNYSLQVSDTEELLVEYSDSATESWYDIDAADGVLNIEKKTSNGDIVFHDVLSKKYKCFVENGDITGTLNGDEKDYLIVVKIKNGDSSIRNHVMESSKTIEFNVKNGNVDVDFYDNVK